MESLTTYWNNLDTRGRGLLVGGVAALVVVLVILSRVATAPSFALLYSGLEPAAAGDVVAALEARGVPYRITGTAIEGRRGTTRCAAHVAGRGGPSGQWSAGVRTAGSLVRLRHHLPDVRRRLLAREGGGAGPDDRRLAAHPCSPCSHRQSVRRPVSARSRGDGIGGDPACPPPVWRRDMRRRSDISLPHRCPGSHRKTSR